MDYSVILAPIQETDSALSLVLLGDSPHKGQVEADGKLEVQLNGCTLMIAPDSIFDLNVNLK